MLGVRLDPVTDAGLSHLAKRSGMTKSEIARQLISKHVRLHDEIERDEARRQSLRAVARGWSADDAYWEALFALDDPDAAPVGQDGA